MQKSIIVLLACIGLVLAGYKVLAHEETAVYPNPTHITDDHFIYLPVAAKPFPPQHKIVFASNYETGGAYDIFLMNTDGTGLRNLTNTPDLSEISPVWSPDGAMIAFVSAESYGSPGDIFIMDANGANRRNVSGDLNSENIELVWSPDSRRLAFVSDMGNDWHVFDVFLVNSDGSGLANVTHTNNLSERVPQWSADGRQIVFTSTDSSHTSIMKVNADGSGKTAVYTDNDGANYWPQWIPNQTRISFIKKPSNPGCLYTIHSDGSDGFCMTDFPGLYSAGNNRWNSDGTKLLLQGYDPLESYWQYLYTFEPAAQQLQKLALCSPMTAFDWSPDGTQIVYVAPAAYKPNIFVAGSDGANPQNLTGSLNSQNRDPNWSPVVIP